MLNNIQNDNIKDITTSTQGLESIKGNSSKERIDNDNNYFIDQSDISTTAIEKYQKEQDIKFFSDILMQSDEKEAINKVLEDVFNEKYSIDNDDFLSDLLTNEDFINDVIE